MIAAARAQARPTENGGQYLNTTLANNGGATLTHLLAQNSLAQNLVCVRPVRRALDPRPSTLSPDQRGQTRPQSTSCDVGALESLLTADTPQTGATLVVNVTNNNNGGCTFADCSLREAISQANGDGIATTITFNIPGSGVQTIAPTGGILPSNHRTRDD